MGNARGALGNWFEQFSSTVTKRTGTTAAFALACGTVIVWAALGPVFHFSNTWQLVINTGTTIVTFLMVFLIQRSQNKESLAVQLKLNELVAAVKGASNRLIDVEDLSEDELTLLHQHFRQLVEMAKKDQQLGASHSIEEAQHRHSSKVGRTKRTASGE
jgi:low affinity Fe/Cu permease